MIVLPFLRFVVLHSFRPARPLMRRLIVLLELIVLILNSQERYKNPRGLCCCCPLGLHWEDESEMQYLYKRFEKSGTDSQRRAGQCPLLGTCFDPPSHCTCGFCTILLANIITIFWLFFQAYLLCIIIFLFIVFFSAFPHFPMFHSALFLSLYLYGSSHGLSHYSCLSSELCTLWLTIPHYY